MLEGVVSRNTYSLPFPPFSPKMSVDAKKYEPNTRYLYSMHWFCQNILFVPINAK